VLRAVRKQQPAQVERFPIPWWRISAAALLTLALVLSIRRGSWIESTIIAALALPTYAILGAYVYAYLKQRRFANPS
jgi:hypothetical protein